MIKIFTVNPFMESTYVVSDSTKECVIIDCGALSLNEQAKIDNYIETNGLKPVMALNTHAHIDHILGVKYLQEKYGAKFALNSEDLPTLSFAKQSVSMFGIDAADFETPTIDIDLKGLSQISFGQTTFQIIPSPGHTSGGVCFYLKEEKKLFTGDTLFAGSIGRTDLPTGDYDALMSSIIKNLLPLVKDGEVEVLPGHGGVSTLMSEMTTNPFITEYVNNEINPECE